MEQLTLDTGYYKNPRSRYLIAVNKDKIEDDYLDNSRFYVATHKWNDRYVRMYIGFLKGKSNNNIKVISRIFDNINQRVLLDSLIFYLSLNQVADITGLTPVQVELYKEIFFDIGSTTYLDRLDIQKFILSEDILNWYQKLEYLDYESLRFLLKGTQRQNKIEEQLKMLADRFFNIAMTATQGIVTTDTIQSGLDYKSKELYNVGVAATQLFIGLSRTYFQYSDVINRDADVFLKDWKFLLKSNNVEQLPESSEETKSIQDQAKFLHLKSEELEKKLKQHED